MHCAQQGNGGFLSGFVGALWPMADGPAGGSASHFTDGSRGNAGLHGIGNASPLLLPGVRRSCRLWDICRMLSHSDACRSLGTDVGGSTS